MAPETPEALRHKLPPLRYEIVKALSMEWRAMNS